MTEQHVAHVLPTVVAGDPIERLASLFDVHYERLYRLARRLVPSADDALDLVQETFLRAARSPFKIPVGKPNEEAWLVRVLINIRRDQWRRTSARDRLDKPGFGRGRPAIGGDNPEEALIAKTAVWRALNTLPPRRRAIVVMYELEGLAIPAIASLLGISGITVRWHLSTGRRVLTRELKAYMGESNENH